MISEYDTMIEELITQLSDKEQDWFRQVQSMQRLSFKLLACPWWRPFHRYAIRRQLLREVGWCDQLYREITNKGQPEGYG